MPNHHDDEYSPYEIARRRDAVIHRMANTSPQPRATSKVPRKAKVSASGRGSDRTHSRRDASAKPPAAD